MAIPMPMFTPMPEIPIMASPVIQPHIFDGGNQTVGGSASNSMYTQFLAKVNQCLAVPTSFKIDIFGSQIWNDYNITSRVEKVGRMRHGKCRGASCFKTESNIPVNWFNQTQVDNVNRLMVPDWGLGHR